MHFLNSLRQFVHVKNIPVPPNLFVNEAADPAVPGSAPTPPGALDVFGKKIELFRLYFTVIQMGGFNKACSGVLVTRLFRGLTFGRCV